ncbi:MAG: TetR/AcrR family transcriptional regulator [Desulfobacteraceae bacterium]|nr:MAG: TetR/AcrR family transcriptional regulator [Desulfobacteraceae bacterium]
MPKPQRKPQEIAAAKETILAHAVQLIIQEGYHGFSMRKLASRLGIAAKTIYNYFKNKDELYLVILTKGFELLYSQFRDAYHSRHNPLERIDAMAETYLDFGLQENSFYNLMFTWHVPKYNDYRGTMMEPAARRELEMALKVADFFVQAIQECGDKDSLIPEEKARFLMIAFWTQMHGYIAGYNNTLLNYMHENPIALKEKILVLMKDNFRKELKGLGCAKVYPIKTGIQKEKDC